ncbi:MAG: sugar phosphate nucleotidyltransferase [Bacteroidales bacterium]|nr:sugar phosphate nucleotidyltransferase [Bacteroidales bacterium]
MITRQTMQAMILAAGLGTRLKPITDKLPKALIPVRLKDGCQGPLLGLLLDKMCDQGVTRVVVNVHHFAPQIRTYLDEYLKRKELPLQIAVSDESPLLLDTGGAIREARLLLDPQEPFLIHNVDILSNLRLDHFFARHKASDLATLLVSRRDTPRQLLFDRHWRLVGWTNTQKGEIRWVGEPCNINDCTMRAFAGIHIMSARAMPLMEPWPRVFSVIDFYLDSARSHVIRGIEIPGLEITDIGKPLTLDNILL